MESERKNVSQKHINDFNVDVNGFNVGVNDSQVCTNDFNQK